MIQPPALHVGDSVALVATARKITPDDVASAQRLFTAWGLKVLLPEGLYAADGQLAGSDSHRTALFQQLLDDDAVRAIVCVRGGYGTVRMVDGLCLDHFAQHPKWVVGYSDVTVLHSHLLRHGGVQTLHATMPLNIPADAYRCEYPSTEALRRALFGEDIDYRFASHPLNRCGVAQGEVVGGNLSVLYSLVASPSEVAWRDRILFIEDLDEYLYHIDRMMQNLRRSGRLRQLRAVVVGGMTDMHDNAVPFGRTAEQIVRDAVADYDYPICFSAPFGHIGTRNLALPMGARCSLDITPDGTRLTVIK